MKIQSFTIIIGLFSIFFACSKAPQNQVTTKLGNKFIFHYDSAGVNLKEGDVALCIAQRWVGDSLDMSTSFRNLLLPFTVQSEKDVTKDAKVQDILYHLSVGDSISAIQEMDSFLKAKYKHLDVDHFVMNLKIVEVGGPGTSEAQLYLSQYGDSTAVANRLERKNALRHQMEEYIDSYKLGKETKLVQLDSGISLKVLEEGTGPQIGKDQYVRFDLMVLFEDKSFLNTTLNEPRPQFIPTGAGQTISGLDKVLQYAKTGSKYFAYIPYQLAYGEQASKVVPPKTNLMMYVEVREAIPVWRDAFMKKYYPGLYQ
jgi:FKBP-type peptidyl-prolyl cis-trans isomerase